MEQVLTKGGKARRGERPSLTAAAAREVLGAMLALREADRLLTDAAERGQLPAWRSAASEVALIAGVSFALADGDFLLPTPRALDRVVLDHAFGRPLHVVEPATPGAARMVHAAGIGWAARLRGEPAVACALLGEGAIAQSDFHVGVNFAAVQRAQVVFVVTVSDDAPAGVTADDRGAAWGIAARTVDAGDALAVHRAVSEAAAAARAGDGPTLVLAVTGRREDPVDLLTAFVQSGGATSDEDLAALEQTAARSARAMVQRAMAPGREDPQALFDHVTSTDAPLFAAQRDEARQTKERAPWQR